MATASNDTKTPLAPITMDPAAPFGWTRSGKPRTEAQYRAKLQAKAKATAQAAFHRVTRRCSSCGLLCSLEGADPEIESEDVDGSMLYVTVRVVLNSACCGEEVASQSFDLEIDLEGEHDCQREDTEPCEECNGSGKVQCPDCEGSGVLVLTSANPLATEQSEEPCEKCDGSGEVECETCEGEGELEVEEPDEPFELYSTTANYVEDVEDTIKHGKHAGKRVAPRYSKTLRGAEVIADLKCNACGEDFTVTHTETAPASTFENSY